MKRLSEAAKSSSQRISAIISGNEFLLLAVLIIFLGALWRIWGLAAFTGFSKEELSLLQQSRDLVSKGWTMSPNLSTGAYTYLLAGIGSLTGYKVVALRLFSATIGVLASVFFFLFVKSWFNKQVALISTLLMATSTTMLILSSVINPTMFIILIQMLVLYLVTVAFRDKNIWLFLLSAIVIAIGIFTSPYFILIGMLVFAASIVIVSKNPKIFSVYRWELTTIIGITLLAIAGYGFYFRSNLSELLTYLNPGSFARFYLNLGSNLLSLFASSQYISNISVSIEPILDPFVAVSAVCGIVYAFFHGGKRKHQFILLWLLFGVIIISLSATQSIEGLALITPIIFVISGMMLDYLLTSWVRTFPFNKSARLAMTLIFSLFLFLSIYYNYQKYFYGWQGNPKISSQYTLMFDKNK